MVKIGALEVVWFAAGEVAAAGEEELRAVAPPLSDLKVVGWTWIGEVRSGPFKWLVGSPF